MARVWIKARKGLRDEIEVIRMAARLGVDEDLVVGKLIHFWGWADSFCNANGNAPGVTCAWINRHARLDGFAEALEAVGWLTVEDYGLIIPNFDRHFGEGAKAKELAADRVRRHRERSNKRYNAALKPPNLPPNPVTHDALPETETETEKTPLTPRHRGDGGGDDRNLEEASEIARSFYDAWGWPGTADGLGVADAEFVAERIRRWGVGVVREGVRMLPERLRAKDGFPTAKFLYATGRVLDKTLDWVVKEIARKSHLSQERSKRESEEAARVREIDELEDVFGPRLDEMDAESRAEIENRVRAHSRFLRSATGGPILRRQCLELLRQEDRSVNTRECEHGQEAATS